MSRLEFLDAGRGIAILGVIAVHTVAHFSTGIPALDFAVSTGQFGVQLFYVISAYTMQYTLSSREGKEASPIANFWIRRYCRIAVPFWAGMIVYEAFRASGVGFFASTSADPFSLATSFLLIQGFWPSSLSAVVPGGGTIATEVIFYGIFPAVFLMRGNVVRIAIFGLCMIVFDHWVMRPAYMKLFAAADCGFTPEDMRTFFYYYIGDQMPIFLLGAYVYVLGTSGLRRSQVPALLAFLAADLFVNPKLAVIGLVAAALLYYLRGIRQFPSPLIWVGRHSYSLYLFHFAVLNGLIIASSHLSIRPGLGAFLLAYAAAIAGACAISALTRPLLEDAGTSIGRFLVGLNERRAHTSKVAAPL